MTEACLCDTEAQPMLLFIANLQCHLNVILITKTDRMLVNQYFTERKHSAA